MTMEDHELAELLAEEGINDPHVLKAIESVPRAEFVCEKMKRFSHADEALPIGSGQTISQPFVVARMTALLLDGRPCLKTVLEIGTGSGYQAAILSQVCENVYTIERIKALYSSAKTLLADLHYDNVHMLFADGNLGWPEHAPFEGIVVTAAADEIPEILLDQLNPKNGRMIVPVRSGHGWQELQMVEREGEDYTITRLDPVVFVPLLKGIE